MRQIPEDNLAYPVFIQTNSGTGTGFFIGYKNNSYFITAKHVLCRGDTLKDDNALITFKSNLMGSKEYFFKTLNLNLSFLLDVKKLKLSETHDVAVLQIFQTDTETNVLGKLVEGIVPLVNNDGGFTRVHPNHVLKQDAVYISNDVFIFGFPTSIGIRDTPQYDNSLPLVRKGIVSQIYQEKGTIILDCQVHHGNSGGPVLQVTYQEDGRVRYDVIGVLIQYIPYITTMSLRYPNGMVSNTVQDAKNSGYSVAVSMDVVLDTINQI